MATAAVLTEAIARHYGDVRAVDGVDIEVQEGEIYGFLGPNGAGKSTLIRILCTLLMPTSGRAAVAGIDVAAHPGDVRLRIGVALQDAALDDRQTGRELLRLQARLYGLRRHEIDQRVGEVLRMVDIGEAVDRRIGTYSGGMKRRLDLAAALVHNPDIVFLDEPTTGLDPASRALVWHEVQRLNENLGMTIFLTTQYLEEADELADRVGIISHGKLVAEGTPDELKRSIGTDVIIARVSRSNDEVLGRLRAIDGVDHVSVHENEISVRVRDGAAAISPVAVTLAACEVEVQSLTLRTPTLDDVFLELTGAHIEEKEDA